MANLVVKDGTGASKYIAQSGAGTDIDPFVRVIEGEVTANPPAYTWTTISGVKDSAGGNTLVAAPAAGYRHLIKLVQLQLEEDPAGAFQRVLLKSGTTELWRFVGANIPDGLVQYFATGDELPCGEAEAISLDLAEAKDVGYVLRYRTEAI